MPNINGVVSNLKAHQNNHRSVSKEVCIYGREKSDMGVGQVIVDRVGLNLQLKTLHKPQNGKGIK